jgi:sugar transferase (PEP-CTERM/EpsH1 system associated)
MANLLYLVHRMPYPPTKGDKVRSYHLLQHLRQRHRVFVGTFIDDPDDAQHVQALRGLCAGLYIAPLHPLRARLASLAGLLKGDALTLHFYRHAGLREWVAQTVARESIDAVVVFSSSMAQYAEGLSGLPVLVDFVDVDSAKWTAYAEQHRWPMSWLYRREGAKLLAYEREVARHSRRSFFSTDRETELFVQMAPECAGGVEPMSNGVDAQFFAPAADRPSPYAAGETPLVFTGAMDYWPNIDAVTWFAREVMPLLLRRRPGLRFHIVGRAPAPAVRALACENVVVTGTVPDVRPYLQHAAVVVAPLRLARGIQNKILEAMAMGRPVVAAQSCVGAMHVLPGQDVLPARDAEDYLHQILALLDDVPRAADIGASGRRCVVEAYSWAAHLQVFDRHLQFTLQGKPPSAALPALAAAAGVRA